MRPIIILGTLVAILAVALVGWLGYHFGRFEEGIMTGSPAYFMLHDIASRLEAGDAAVASDIRAALAEMDPKNNTGVNGPAMIRYHRRRPASGGTPTVPVAK